MASKASHVGDKSQPEVLPLPVVPCSLPSGLDRLDVMDDVVYYD